MVSKSHLLLQHVILAPAEEWTVPPAPWVVLRLDKGMGYWISPSARLELAQGDMMLISDRAQGILRTSQLGEAALFFYTVNPYFLGGFFTLAERHAMQVAQSRIQGLPLHFPARHSLAVDLGRVCETASEMSPLVQRCRLLYLFAIALQPQLTTSTIPTANGQSEKRFKELMASLSEPELLRFTPLELAGQCGCSPRHFARLFQSHFGCSVREKFTELRLYKARELLLLSESTVAGVAVATGFRDPAKFNNVFKKYFGQTPRRWREQQRKLEGTPHD